jgi:glycerate kinase
VLERIGFAERLEGADLVVTGEGTVDTTTFEGKAPAAVLAAAQEAGVRCVLFGGVVERVPEGVEATALKGDPARARDDLVELGERLAG